MQSLSQPHEVSAITHLHYMDKTINRFVKQLSQCHIASKEQSLGSNLRCLTPGPKSMPTVYTASLYSLPLAFAAQTSLLLQPRAPTLHPHPDPCLLLHLHSFVPVALSKAPIPSDLQTLHHRSSHSNVSSLRKLFLSSSRWSTAHSSVQHSLSVLGPFLQSSFLFWIHIYVLLSPYWHTSRTDSFSSLFFQVLSIQRTRSIITVCWINKHFTARQSHVKVAFA